MLKRVHLKSFLSALLVLISNSAGYTENASISPSPALPRNRQTKQVSSRVEAYLQMMHEHPFVLGPLGSWKKGEIEIILNPEQIKKIENQMKLRLISKGVNESEAACWSSVGVVAEDNYWMWIRDAVIFPSGVYGTYDRILWKSGIDGPPGVAIFPVLSNKKIVVNLNYRHATRSWEIELPRGQKRANESLENAAFREVREETGYSISKATLLGSIAPESGVLTSVVPLFFGDAFHSGETNKEFSEAIPENPVLSKQEIKEGFAKGYVEVVIKGQIIKANCRDPFLAIAILQAEGKGLL